MRRGAQAAAARGRLRGLGIALFSRNLARHARASAPRSASTPDGTVALVLGTQSNGQGHETSYPQIAADLLGLPLEAFRFVQADTRAVKSGNGHGGARSMHMGGTALHQAAQMVLSKRAARLPPTCCRPMPTRSCLATGGSRSRDGERGIDLLALRGSGARSRPICRTA